MFIIEYLLGKRSQRGSGNIRINKLFVPKKDACEVCKTKLPNNKSNYIGNNNFFNHFFQ